MRTGVIGSGQMGSGIAQVCATQGLVVYLCDRDAEQLERAKAGIASSAQKLHGKKSYHCRRRAGRTAQHYLCDER